MAKGKKKIIYRDGLPFIEGSSKSTAPITGDVKPNQYRKKYLFDLTRERLEKELNERTRQENWEMLRYGCSPGELQIIERWAKEDQDVRLRTLAENIRRDNLYTFTCTFTHRGIDGHTADVIGFLGMGIEQFHIDYELKDGKRGMIYGLFKNEHGDWASEGDSGDPYVYTDIGRAIEAWVNRIKQTGSNQKT